MSWHKGKKLCRRCNAFLPPGAFKPRRQLHSLGEQPWCIDCKREYDRLVVAAKRANAKGQER